MITNFNNILIGRFLTLPEEDKNFVEKSLSKPGETLT